MESGLAFGFFNEENFTWPKIPASYGTIKLQTGRYNFTHNKFDVIHDHELMTINQVDTSWAFVPGSPILSSQNREGALTVKNTKELTLVNNLEDVNGIVVRLIVYNCTGEAVECAPKDEVLDWLSHNKFLYSSKLNFIDYEEVSLTGDHVQAMFETIYVDNIGINPV